MDQIRGNFEEEGLLQGYINNFDSTVVGLSKRLMISRSKFVQGLLEGSKEYVELEKKAKSFFLTNVTMDDEDKSLLAILLNTSYDYEKFKREECDLPASDG